MEKLPIAQQIKIIKASTLRIPVYRAPTEEYDEEHPTRYDRHVKKEIVEVNVTIGYLLRTIEYLSKEIILSNRPLSTELWTNLKGIRLLIKSQSHTQPERGR